MTKKQREDIKKFAKSQSVEDTITMILSTNCDMGSTDGPLISVGKFPEIVKDLIDFYPQLTIWA